MSLLETIALFGSVYGEGVALAPWQGGLYPGARAGIEVPYSRSERVEIVQQAHLGAWVHPRLQQASTLSTEIDVRPRLGPASVDAGIGLGGLLSHASAPRFTLGRPVFHASRWDLDLALLLGLGADLRLREGAAIFTRCEWLLEAPFGLLGNPILPHRNLHLGLRVALGGAR